MAVVHVLVGLMVVRIPTKKLYSPGQNAAGDNPDASNNYSLDATYSSDRPMFNPMQCRGPMTPTARIATETHRFPAT